MSHVVASLTIITDIDCLKKALEKFPKLKWREGQTRFAWFGSWQNDYSASDAAYKLGIDTDDYGKCEHAIHMDGVNYEIGLMKRKDGKGYSLVWDFFADGATISQYIGVGAEKLMAEYHRQLMLKHAYSEGYNYNQEEDEDSITIEIDI